MKTHFTISHDEDNQDEYTYERVKDWANKLRKNTLPYFKELNDLV